VRDNLQGYCGAFSSAVALAPDASCGSLKDGTRSVNDPIRAQVADPDVKADEKPAGNTDFFKSIAEPAPDISSVSRIGLFGFRGERGVKLPIDVRQRPDRRACPQPVWGFWDFLPRPRFRKAFPAYSD